MPYGRRLCLSLMVPLMTVVCHCSAYAWDTTGHVVVTLIVEPRLTPDAAASVTQWHTSEEQRRRDRGTVVDWAVQSHDPACRFGSDQRLDEKYRKQAQPIIETHLREQGEVGTLT